MRLIAIENRDSEGDVVLDPSCGKVVELLQARRRGALNTDSGVRIRALDESLRNIVNETSGLRRRRLSIQTREATQHPLS